MPSNPAEVKKAKKQAYQRLGIPFVDDDEDDLELEKELANDGDVDMDDGTGLKSPVEPSSVSPIDVTPLENIPKKDKERSLPPARSASPPLTSPTTPTGPDVDLSALSARERNRLKRKRKPGNSAFVAGPPPQASGAKYTPAPVAGSSNKYALVSFFSIILIGILSSELD